MTPSLRRFLIILAVFAVLSWLPGLVPLVIIGGFLWYAYLKKHNISLQDWLKEKFSGQTPSKPIIEYDHVTSNPTPMAFPKLSFKTWSWLVIGLVALFLLIDGFVSVPAGSIAVIYDRGRGVLSETLPEGLHLKIPFWQVAYKLTTRTQEYTMSSTPGEGAVFNDDSMQAPTSDGQQVSIEATVLFHLNPESGSTLFQKVGPDYVEKIIRPISRSQIRMVISRYSASDIYSSKRAEAEQAMNDDITKLFAEKEIVLERVLLRNVAFSPEYASAIEAKQIAQQNIQKAEYEKQEAEKVKERTIIEAQASAESIRLKGETLRANPQVIQYEFVQKMAPNVSWGILPSGSVPFLDLKGMLNQ